METNKLTPQEIAWLKEAFRRYMMNAADVMDRLGGDTPDLWDNLADDFALLTRLMRSGRIGVEDRVPLMEDLRRRRRMLLVHNPLTEPLQQEADFIAGFLKRLSQMDWEALGIPDAPHDPYEYWRSFRITEAQASIVLKQAGVAVSHTEGLQVGSQITLTQEGGDGKRREITVRVARAFAPMITTWEAGRPQLGLMFEGIVAETDPGQDDEIFGLLFLFGRGVVLNASPDSDYVYHLIRKGVLPELE